MKKLIVVLLAIALAVVLYFLFRGGDEVTINDKVIKVEIADEKEEQELGLMNRESLDTDKGMLFVYAEPKVPEFWMKNMLIPLDMIFISPDKTINYIEKNVPVCNEENSENCPTYGSPQETQYILEVNAGYTEKNNIKVGDKVEF